MTDLFKPASNVEASFDGAACGKNVSGDPAHQRHTWNFSKEEIKDSSRNKGYQKVHPDGFEPETP